MLASPICPTISHVMNHPNNINFGFLYHGGVVESIVYEISKALAYVIWMIHPTTYNKD